MHNYCQPLRLITVNGYRKGVVDWKALRFIALECGFESDGRTVGDECSHDVDAA